MSDTISRETVEGHRAKLIEQEKRLLADLHATSGAIQNCDFFLSILDKQCPETKPEQ